MVWNWFCMWRSWVFLVLGRSFFELSFYCCLCCLVVSLWRVGLWWWLVVWLLCFCWSLVGRCWCLLRVCVGCVVVWFWLILFLLVVVILWWLWWMVVVCCLCSFIRCVWVWWVRSVVLIWRFCFFCLCVVLLILIVRISFLLLFILSFWFGICWSRCFCVCLVRLVVLWSVGFCVRRDFCE